MMINIKDTLTLDDNNEYVVVSKIIDGNNVIFFEGVTDNSGVIDRITLPTPTLKTDDLIAPNGNVIHAPENGWRWAEESVKETEEKINELKKLMEQ